MNRIDKIKILSYVENINELENYLSEIYEMNYRAAEPRGISPLIYIAKICCYCYNDVGVFIGKIIFRPIEMEAQDHRNICLWLYNIFCRDKYI
jgi:hypothetical protein